VSGLHALLVLPVVLSVPWIAERVRADDDAPVLDIVAHGRSRMTRARRSSSTTENDVNDNLLTHHAGKSEFLSASSD
jgi:antitoxin (DNA-binding transcriptional repressor) of toxin-antitoxin stability system